MIELNLDKGGILCLPANDIRAVEGREDGGCTVHTVLGREYDVEASAPDVAREWHAERGEG